MKLNIFGRGRSLQWAITFTCDLAFIFFGYDQGVMSGLVTQEDFLSVVGYPDASLEGIMLSIYNLGCFTGCLVNFALGDMLGRRRAMWFAMGWIVVGATIQASAFSIAQIMAGRFITGIGTGIETSTVPMYQAEIASAHNRGRLVCSEITFIGIGLVVSAFFDYGMVQVSGPLGWRLPVAFQLVFAFIVIFMVFGLPESPRYLYSKGRHEEAFQVLLEVHDRDADDAAILQEQNNILEALRLEEVAAEFSWRKVFQQDRVQTGKRILLAYLMQFMNQMGGINVAVYYMPTILTDNVGLSSRKAVLLGACINIMFLVGSLVPTFFADRLGRRKPMMWGSFGCGLSMMCVSILLSFKNNDSTAIASVAFFFTFMLVYGMTVASVPWCYVPEILPLHARAKGTAIAISSNWLWNFFIVMITPVLIRNITWKSYLIFMCLNWAFIPLVYYCYPETANLTLEEIDLLYTEKDESPRKVAERLQRQMKENGHGILEAKYIEAGEGDIEHHEVKRG